MKSAVSRLCGACAGMLVAACAAPVDTGPAARGTYRATGTAAPGSGDALTARARAHDDAVTRCAAMGGEPVIESETVSPPAWMDGLAVATLAFHCLVRGG